MYAPVEMKNRICSVEERNPALWKYTRMLSKPTAMPMKQLPNPYLGICIAAAKRGHHVKRDFFFDYVDD
jgi:hypothetical protein